LQPAPLPLLDEPYSGLDARAAAHHDDFLVEHRRQGGSVLLVSHHLVALHQSCDRLAVLAGGRIALAVAAGEISLPHLQAAVLEGLVLVSRTGIGVDIGKVLATVVFLVSVEGMILVLLAVLYNVDLWRHVPALVLVMGLGTVGFAAVGTLYAAITVQVRACD